jgi:DNA polymerase-4
MAGRLRKIIHVDMDAFFAAVEQRDNPRLRGRPVVVGGPPEGRGVVSTASYEARAFGIHSAMPSAEAAQRCPDAIFVAPDMGRYRAVSEELRGIFLDYTDLVEPLSLDEAFLDVTTNRVGLVHAVEVARDIRRRIDEELGLTASAGVAPLKFVAKLASDWRKPDGLTVVAPDEVLDFIQPLPVEKLWGVGPATAKRLHALGLLTVGDIARASRKQLEAKLGRSGGFLWGLANGRDSREVTPSRPRKSRSAERTFPRDVTSLAELSGVLERLVDRVCDDLHKATLVGRTVTVKVRYGDFQTVTRSLSLPEATADEATLLTASRELLTRTEAGTRPVRLLGVGVTSIEKADAEPAQLGLWGGEG